MFDLTITIRDTEENGQGEKTKKKKCDDHLELRKHEAEISQWVACLWTCQGLGVFQFLLAS